ncbi:NifU family protein [Pacificimonas sp. WHA3]|uniref:NifU family protein n=1 Tax=Pacificimonas pallii TaxID=2827236 RepID=A0ABS6SD08_9SPHN|nr:NifU family protein [Pacificimonas pallii]MBV7256304.1 NifU family protein [Pacificimonas pallii]
MHVQTQTTPNPATLMFQPGRQVSPSGTHDFASPEDAEASPLAAALFSLGDVTGVFLGSDFVSVTRDPAGADWVTLKPVILSVIVDHFASGAPVLNEVAAETGPAIEEDPDTADIRKQIMELLDDRVRPAVAGDGGDIVFHGFSDGIVYLKMQGACDGCPSSTATLKNGIENLLRYYVPEVEEVRAV